MDIVNETEEEIVIPPGESVRVHGYEDDMKVMVSRRRVFTVNRTGTDPMDGVTMVKCEDCGELVPVKVMDVGGHECS